MTNWRRPKSELRPTPTAQPPGRDPLRRLACQRGTDAQTCRICSGAGMNAPEVAPDGLVCQSNSRLWFYSRCLTQAIGVAWSTARPAGGERGCQAAAPWSRASVPEQAPGRLADETEAGGRRAARPRSGSTRCCHTVRPQAASELSLLCRSHLLGSASEACFPGKQSLLC